MIGIAGITEIKGIPLQLLQIDCRDAFEHSAGNNPPFYKNRSVSPKPPWFYENHGFLILPNVWLKEASDHSITRFNTPNACEECRELSSICPF